MWLSVLQVRDNLLLASLFIIFLNCSFALHSVVSRYIKLSSEPNTSACWPLALNLGYVEHAYIEISVTAK